MNGRAAKVSRRGEAARVAALDARIEAIWARIPDAGCKGLCSDSCGPIGMSDAERDRIARRHGVTIRHAETKPGTLNCPALDGGRCSVYADRPAVCRSWGAVEALPCPHGCQPAAGRLTDAEAADVMRASLALDGRDPIPAWMVGAVTADPVAGPLFSRAMRGDRSAYPALADAVDRLMVHQDGRHAVH